MAAAWVTASRDGALFVFVVGMCVIGENTADDLTADDQRCAGGCTGAARTCCAGEQGLLTGLRGVRAGLSHREAGTQLGRFESGEKGGEAEPSGARACNRSALL
jgi:hypothetical protein